VNYRNLTVMLLASALLVAVSACRDDDGPRVRTTMANIWPHADGTSWTYEMDYTEYMLGDGWGGDELPSMESLHAALQKPLARTPAVPEAFIYGMAFDGMVTTAAGVEAQRLVETLEPVASDSRFDTGSVVEPGSRRLLRLIARARPDLRAAALEILGDEALSVKSMFSPFPVFIGGNNFAYEDSGYYGYGDLHADHSWIYLEGGLRAGEEFKLQLARGLANDIWLYGRTWSVGGRRIDGVWFSDIVEYMYVVDLGVQQVVNEEGEPMGTFRSYVYGNVFYCPEVGPVAGREHHVLGIRTAYDPELESLGLEFDYHLLEVVLPQD